MFVVRSNGNDPSNVPPHFNPQILVSYFYTYKKTVRNFFVITRKKVSNTLNFFCFGQNDQYYFQSISNIFKKFFRCLSSFYNFLFLIIKELYFENQPN